MCTAATYRTNDSYFGRNLDLERSYHESVTITPRNFRLDFRREDPMDSHLAMIGMATVANGYPLYYDATNEMGLSMAGLNFPENAVYRPEVDGMDNIATFELIPWILGRCATVPASSILFLQDDATWEMCVSEGHLTHTLKLSILKFTIRQYLPQHSFYLMDFFLIDKISKGCFTLENSIGLNSLKKTPKSLTLSADSLLSEPLGKPLKK